MTTMIAAWVIAGWVIAGWAIAGWVIGDPPAAIALLSLTFLCVDLVAGSGILNA